MEMDHKPLKMIRLKNLTAAPACLQRMLLHLQQYDLVIMYRTGKEMLLADALSCHFHQSNGFIKAMVKKVKNACKNTDGSPNAQAFLPGPTQIQLDLQVDAISMFAFTLRSLTKISAETQWDPILLMVHRLTLNGWPDRQSHVPRAARFYWSFCDELSIDGDILTKGE